MAVAVVLAGGSGSRMKSDVAKQYMLLCGKEVLFYSLHTFQMHEDIRDIVLVTREEEISYCRKNIVERYGFGKVKSICAGGRERYESVYNGLLSADADEDDIVLVHDAARPFVTAQMIDDSISVARECGACTVGMPVKDTIKIVDENKFGIETPQRSSVYQIQTPQTFRYGLLTSAYEKMLHGKTTVSETGNMSNVTDKAKSVDGRNYKITDDTMLVEQYKGVRSKIVPGTYENIKITTPEDMEIASKFAEKFF